jgi:methionine sulfoxide reductase heme-binding subunit
MILAAASSGKTLWFLTRGLGVGALLLLTASIALGVLTTARWRSPKWPRFVTAGLHRNLTLLAIGFVVIHVLTTILDGYTSIGLKDAVLPFLSSYRPVWLGLGAIAFDLLLILVATSLLRERIGYRVWRYVHWLAYAAWPIALVHALGTGSDARVGWMRIVGVSCVAIVALAALARFALRPGLPTSTRLAGTLAAVAMPFAIAAWYQSGPAEHGWAKRAGTPTSLLASRRTGVSRARSTQFVNASLPRSPFSASLSGTVHESKAARGLLDVVISGRLRGGAGGSVRIDLRGQSIQGGVSMTASGVSYVPAGTRTVYFGKVTGLDGQRVFATVANHDGAQIQLAFVLAIDTVSHVVTGSVSAAPGVG